MNTRSVSKKNKTSSHSTSLPKTRRRSFVTSTPLTKVKRTNCGEEEGLDGILKTLSTPSTTGNLNGEVPVTPGLGNQMVKIEETCDEDLNDKDWIGEKDDQDSILSDEEDKENTTIDPTDVSFQCLKCDLRFRKKTHLLFHIVSHRACKMYECEVCGDKVKTLPALKKHRKTHSDDNNNTISSRKRNDGNNNTISSRKRNDGNNSSSSNNSSTNNGDKKAKKAVANGSEEPTDDKTCRLCGRTYSHRDGVVRHMRTVHHVTPTHMCPVCKACLPSREKLALHTAQTHSDTAHVNCDLCDVTWNVAECGGIKRVNWLKNRHVRVAHEEPLFACTQCQMKFARKDVLKKHQSRCAGARGVADKKFKCEVCEASFTRRDALKRHNLKFHPAESATSSEDDDSDSSLSSSEDPNNN